MEPELKLGFYVITTKNDCLSHIDVAKAAAENGADVVQFRDKSNDRQAKLETGYILREITRRNGVTFIVNDDAELAAELEADGLHIGIDDITPVEARKIIGKKRILGLSASDEKEIKYALDNQVDYIGSGPVYVTTTKPDAGKPIGVEGIRNIIAKVSIPVVAIGGIKLENIEELFNAGASGVALGSALTAGDIIMRTKHCRKNISAMLKERVCHDHY